MGTWCSGITSALHAEGPGFKPQCVQCGSSPVLRPSGSSLSRWAAKFAPRSYLRRITSGGALQDLADPKLRAISPWSQWAHGVAVSHPLRMRKALGSIPSVSNGLSLLWSHRSEGSHYRKVSCTQAKKIFQRATRHCNILRRGRTENGSNGEGMG